VACCLYNVNAFFFQFSAPNASFLAQRKKSEASAAAGSAAQLAAQQAEEANSEDSGEEESDNKEENKKEADRRQLDEASPAKMDALERRLTGPSEQFKARQRGKAYKHAPTSVPKTLQPQRVEGEYNLVKIKPLNRGEQPRL